jgi:hypothetical protein
MMKVIQMNNEASLLIENGHYKQAIQVLRKGNKILVTAMEDEHHQRAGSDARAQRQQFSSASVLMFDCVGNSQSYHADSNNTTNQEESPPPTKPQSPGRTPPSTSGARPLKPVSHQYPNNNEEEEEGAFLYRQPVSISKLPSERQDYIISAIILFNLALAYHLLAWNIKRTSILRNNLLRESLKLYQLSFLMKNRGRLHFDTTFVLAMVNNTADIQTEFGRENKAMALRELMMSTLMMVVDKGQSGSIAEMDGFLATATRSMASNRSRKSDDSRASTATAA